MPRLLDKLIKTATSFTGERLAELEGGIWNSKRGAINISNMTDEHLRNATKYCEMRQRIGHDLSAKMYNAAEDNGKMADIFTKELARRQEEAAWKTVQTWEWQVRNAPYYEYRVVQR